MVVEERSQFNKGIPSWWKKQTSQGSCKILAQILSLQDSCKILSSFQEPCKTIHFCKKLASDAFFWLLWDNFVNVCTFWKQAGIHIFKAGLGQFMSFPYKIFPNAASKTSVVCRIYLFFTLFFFIRVIVKLNKSYEILRGPPWQAGKRRTKLLVLWKLLLLKKFVSRS